jgi:hypothetical protein
MFLISGRPPRLREPLRAIHDTRNETFSITFWPWVSEKTALRAYYATQRSQHNKLPGDKILRVLRFVLEQADQEGHHPSLSELLDRWNAAATDPGERFSSRDGFWRAYQRARKALILPYLPLT